MRTGVCVCVLEWGRLVNTVCVSVLEGGRLVRKKERKKERQKERKKRSARGIMSHTTHATR